MCKSAKHRGSRRRGTVRGRRRGGWCVLAVDAPVKKTKGQHVVSAVTHDQKRAVVCKGVLCRFGRFCLGAALSFKQKAAIIIIIFLVAHHTIVVAAAKTPPPPPWHKHSDARTRQQQQQQLTETDNTANNHTIENREAAPPRACGAPRKRARARPAHTRQKEKKGAQSKWGRCRRSIITTQTQAAARLSASHHFRTLTLSRARSKSQKSQTHAPLPPSLF